MYHNSGQLMIIKETSKSNIKFVLCFPNTNPSYPTRTHYSNSCGKIQDFRTFGKAKQVKSYGRMLQEAGTATEKVYWLGLVRWQHLRERAWSMPAVSDFVK